MPLLDYRNLRDDIEPFGINTLTSVLYWLSWLLLWVGWLVAATALVVCVAWIVTRRNANPSWSLLAGVFVFLAVVSLAIRFVVRDKRPTGHLEDA